MRITRGMVGGFPRLDTNIDKAIEASIKIQLKHGIDILSDGDQRGDMVSYYARSIPGLGIKGGLPVVTGKVRPPANPMLAWKIKDYSILARRYPDLKFKVSVAGPTTMALACGSRKMAGGYRNYTDFAFASDIAAALREIISPIVKRRVMIQVDEPFFSQGLRDLRDRVRLVDEMLEGSSPSLCSIHICGYLGRQALLRELARLENVEVFSHAFSTDRDREKENIEFLRKDVFEDYGKKLAAGIVSVSARTAKDIEGAKTVAGRIRGVVEQIGLDNLAYVTPDCYLRAIDKSLVEGVMVSLRKGVDLFEEGVR